MTNADIAAIVRMYARFLMFFGLCNVEKQLRKLITQVLTVLVVDYVLILVVAEHCHLQLRDWIK
jgi:hypothetical protein